MYSEDDYSHHSGIHQKLMAVLHMDRDLVLSGWTTSNVWDLRQALRSVVTIPGDLIIVTMEKMSPSAVCRQRVRTFPTFKQLTVKHSRFIKTYYVGVKLFPIIQS